MKKIFLKVLSVALISFSFANNSFAVLTDEIGTKTVTSVGTQVLNPGAANETNVAYFRVAEGWQLRPCAFGVMYFDPSTTMGKVFYATLLTAKASGNPLSRVVYDAAQDANGLLICTVTEIIELQ